VLLTARGHTVSVAADIVVCHSPVVSSLCVLAQGEVVRVVGIFRDDVPCVKETGYVAKHAKEDIEKGVSGAEAAFDPYCERDC